MLLSFITTAFFGRSVFFVNDLSEFVLDSSNWEMRSLFKFNYVLYSRWFLRKRFSPFLRKFSRNSFFYFFYINNISFLVGFGLNFVYQRFSFFFRNSFGSLNNWWESFYFSFLFFSRFFKWSFKLRRKRNALKSTKFLNSSFYCKRFFLWDPLDDDFFYSKTRNDRRYFLDVYSNSFKLLQNPFFYNLGYKFGYFI